MNERTNALFASGMELLQAGKSEEAERVYQELVMLDPANADGWQMLGIIAQQAGKYLDSIELLHRAIAIDPAAEFYYNLGNSLMHLKRNAEAAEAFRQAVEVKPNFYEAKQNYGSMLVALGRTDEAATTFEAVVKLRPEAPETQNNLGLALKDLGRVDEALAAFDCAISIRRNYPAAHHNRLYAMHFSPAFDAAMIYERHCRWAEEFIDPLVPCEAGNAIDRSTQRVLRIGYLSPDFRGHPVGRSMLPVLANHDAEAVQSFCYNDGRSHEEVTTRLKASAHVWRDTAGLTDDKLISLLREDRIDILIDLTLHMTGNRLSLFARRPAPISATFIGYPATTGVSQIDYRITDAYLDPPGETEQFNSEKLVRLTHSFWCYADDLNAPVVNELPAKDNGYVTFGSQNNPCKINSHVIALWASVLREVPRSRMLISLNERSGHRSWVATEFERQGVDPDRLAFVTRQPRQLYLQTYNQIDIGLDPFPYNGHMTSCDSFYMGVPVISLRGNTSVGRGGASLLANLGLNELLASSPDEYVRIAASLAGDVESLGGLRRSLRDRMRCSPLMDGPIFAADLERLYRSMWHGYCAR